ncbi:unnamed protein product [Didymodactylos carnosus]|uniref:Uncharacterized protein n=1 Tax=Didymodactylos carnosus TaxID=1234261 RepID=A0A815ILJ4_9BILA|nr:unnamed protein product [Didymodactylos carnosus]CAF1367803.1 unnamed protein product [Didymodactylos carnosus]CAF3850418.1 unnamed protein product [Didymodactylos carnosus]CAF4251231.1 unnamed protein product [Didymodactylos carnosus]
MIFTRLATRQLCLLASIFLTGVGFIGSIILIIIWQVKLTPFRDYGVVIDAGSSHSEIYLYSWPSDKSDGIGLTSTVKQENAWPVPNVGGISGISPGTVDTITNYFQSTIQMCLNAIPNTRKSRTLIFLGATAGMRLLNIENPTLSNNILQSIRTYFSQLPLLFIQPEIQVRIISGSEEGLSGWITANILYKQLYLNNKPSETYGIMDMGGASTQISFIDENDPGHPSDVATMNLFNTDYKVYSHSYLCYGQDQLRYAYWRNLIYNTTSPTPLTDFTMINDPCLQSNYTLYNVSQSLLFNNACSKQNSTINSIYFNFVGTGNYNLCYEKIRFLIDKTNCTQIPTCSFNNVYQPIPISSSNKLVGISSFYNTFNTLAGDQLTSLSTGIYSLNSFNFTYINSIISKVCNTPWSGINVDGFRQYLCLHSTYHWLLLQYGYNFTDANLNNLQIVQKIDGNDIGWTLGYMINQTNYIDKELRPFRMLTVAEFGGLLFMFLFLFLIGTIVTIFIIWFRRSIARKY